MKLAAKKRRRTCADRLRRDLAERQRQRRGGDPAGRVMLQLLGILSGALALFPPMPSFPFTVGATSRRAVSSPPGRAVRPQFYGDGCVSPAIARDSRSRSSRKADLDHVDDEDRGPTARAMERGIDPTYYRTSSRAAPTWSKLVKDLKRRQTADRARELIEFRVPPEAVEWLHSRIYLEDWLSLRLLGRDGASDDEIAAAALAEAQRWQAAQSKPPEPEPKPEPDGSGDPDSGAGPKP
ncbi:hypothetical protein EDE05_117108 [Neorhizobium sp. R1-B]|uniref:hypothetical protein n=1 Tax=Neorhizobium sp. R1-B TaxID=2485162 RepID=UPI001066A55E|nr:hypothetical protein [Neorhizobium sp. R1-B]TDX76226.1 hypothetical protein EDE05_117108 [Neorhizobium sp. R1-B]